MKLIERIRRIWGAPDIERARLDMVDALNQLRDAARITGEQLKRFQVNQFRVKKGDVVIVRVPSALRPDDIAKLREGLSGCFGDGVKVGIVHGVIDLTLLSKPRAKRSRG